MSYSVIIPSKNASNVLASIEAIRLAGEKCPIIVIDDFEDMNEQARARNCAGQWHRYPIEFVRGKKPFVFSRNMNIGIAEAGRDDVVLLNDDALLKTTNGFSLLEDTTLERTDIGILAPVTNVTGAREQMPQKIGLRFVEKIAFVCVYIPRLVLDAVGLLDERFVTYGWEDNDYCHRVKRAGLKIAVHDFVFVDHGSLTSTFRGGPHAAGDIEPGRKIFQEKWGFSA